MNSVLSALVLFVLITRALFLDDQNRTEQQSVMFQNPITSRITQRVCESKMKQKRNTTNLKMVPCIDTIRTVINHPKNDVIRKGQNQQNSKNLIHINTKSNEFVSASECAKIAFINCQSLNNKPEIVLDYTVDNGINVCFSGLK